MECGEHLGDDDVNPGDSGLISGWQFERVQHI